MTGLAELLGESPEILALRQHVERVLRRHGDGRRLPPVLVQGETGTGKGLLARALHRASPRRDGPFVDVNCAAIPETLLEAEMFGFERGAFTDARHAKPGLFQSAHRGAIFLDEVGLLPEALQGKLLKVLEEQTVRRLGSTKSEPVDVWIVAASNEDLAVATREARFRADLYHRIAVLTLRLPPLRERGDDVLMLADHFLARACVDYALPPKTLAPDARAALLAHAWPGNVRELWNVMERVALLSDAPAVTTAMLGLPQAEPHEARRAGGERSRRSRTAKPRGGAEERERLHETLERTGWNLSQAAAEIGIPRNTLRYRLERHGLRAGPGDVEREKPAAAEPSRPEPARGYASVRWEPRRVTWLRAVVTGPHAGDAPFQAARGVDLIVEKIHSFGGRVEERGPSQVLSAFGLEPTEDAPRRAAHAAMAARKAIDRTREDAGPLAATIGVHVGQFLVGHAGTSVEVDLQAKQEAWRVLDALMEAAPPGAIVASAAARPLLERHFDLVAAPGAPAGTSTYTVVSAERSAFEGPRVAGFVGRRGEMELLRGRLEIAMAGRGQVVGILGAAGLGKSRLVNELRQSLDGTPLTYLEGRCRSYGGATPYLPVLDIIRQNFRIAESDTAEVVAAKVRGGLQELEIDVDEWAPYLLHLLGVREGAERLATLTPGAIKARTFEALRQMVITGSRRRPILFVIEDLHWADATSEECMTALMLSTTSTRAMFIGTYRPGYRPPWLDRSYATQIALPPLSESESLSIVRSVLPADVVPADVSRLILDRAEGNPFFLEELAREVGHSGAVRAPRVVPESIQDVLLARVERLGDGPKRLLQTAAVLGRDMSVELLRAVWDGPGDLESHLQQLTRLEFLSARQGGAEPRYAFVHALTQEVAYASLPPARRETLHAATARALEALHRERREEIADVLGHHYSSAGHAEKAIEYLVRAAENAAFGNAHTEAVRVLEAALGNVERLPAERRTRQRLDLVLRQAASLIYLGRFQDIVDVLLRHHDDLDALKDATLAGQYHFLLARSYLFLGDDERAARHAESAMREATRGGDRATLGQVHYVLAQYGALAGRPREGLEHARQATALLEAAGAGWWIGPAYWAAGLNLALLGDFDAALEAEARATAIAAALGDPQLQSSASWAVGVAHAAIGDWDAGIAACQRAVDRSPDPLDTALALGWLGFACVEKGEAIRAIPVLQQAIAQLGQFRFPQPQGWFIVFLAEAHRLLGRLEAAVGLATQGLRIGTESHSPWGIGCAERALGRIAQARGALDETDRRLGAAYRLFTDIGARYDAARTSMDLATLAHARRDAAGVRRHLAEARRTFAELHVDRYVARADALATQFGIAPDPA
ncbi:MAG: sigma 54-interacting transcriptional regulator [Candidatus Rokubacteria bacterium]|nr:sigma 54-interacting transcriptional regulator [Candidatus Rokubacteria bacterium]